MAAGCAVLAAAACAAQVAAGLPLLGAPGALLAWWAVLAASWVDLRSHRLPDVLVLRLGGSGVLALLAGVLLTEPSRALGVLAGGAIGYGVLAVIAWIYPPGMGYGDVKLAGVLGALLLGPAASAAMLVAAFLLGGVVAVIALASRRIGRRDAVPFGPVLSAAALLVAGVQALVAIRS